MAEILWPHQDEPNQFLMAMLDDPSKKEELLKKKTNIMQIFRIKGIVSVIHDSTQDLLDASGRNNSTPSHGTILLDQRRYIVQAVHDLWEVHPASDNLCFTRDEERTGKVVIIGKHLQAQRLEEGFRACFVES
jgi:G3E family GTPase